MRWRFAWLGLLVWACGGQTDTGDGGLGDGGGVDSTTDVGSPNDGGGGDVSNDVSAGDSGPMDASVDASDGSVTMEAGNIGIWSCGTAMVTDCSMCTGFTQPCAYCNMADASDLRGACVQTGTNCAFSLPMGFQDCLCMTAATCPESYQVCQNFGGGGRCHTCSDTNTNNGLTCQNGGKCDFADGGCL